MSAEPLAVANQSLGRVEAPVLRTFDSRRGSFLVEKSAGELTAEHADLAVSRHCAAGVKKPEIVT